MTTLSDLAQNLVDKFMSGEDSATGYYYDISQVMQPTNYHRVIFSYDANSIVPISSTCESLARKGGWRLLKVTNIEPIVTSMEGRINYAAYARPDIIPLTLGSLKKSVKAELIVMSKSSVGMAESAALDALWVSKGSLSDVTDPMVEEIEKLQGGVKVKLPVVEVVAGGLILLTGAYLLFGKKKKRKK